MNIVDIINSAKGEDDSAQKIHQSVNQKRDDKEDLSQALVEIFGEGFRARIEEVITTEPEDDLPTESILNNLCDEDFRATVRRIISDIANGVQTNNTEDYFYAALFPDWEKHYENTVQQIEQIKPTDHDGVNSLTAVGDILVKHFQELENMEPYCSGWQNYIGHYKMAMAKLREEKEPFGSYQELFSDLKKEYKQSALRQSSVFEVVQKILKHFDLFTDEALRTLVVSSFRHRLGFKSLFKIFIQKAKMGVI